MNENDQQSRLKFLSSYNIETIEWFMKNQLSSTITLNLNRMKDNINMSIMTKQYETARYLTDRYLPEHHIAIENGNMIIYGNNDKTNTDNINYYFVFIAILFFTMWGFINIYYFYSDFRLSRTNYEL
jgi:hypothetical protein